MSKLSLYNTLTKEKKEFVPLDPKNVRMYVCGPTVYDFAHIGNARPVIVFDVLFRLLRHIYGENHVKYVRNITDVDDKINARALETVKESGIPVMDAIREITAETAKQYEEDVTALGCLKPTFEPRATEFVTKRQDNKRDMISLIQMLIDNGHAYPAEGHVLYDVSSKSDYGKLSRRSLDEMIAGARVEVAPYKKNPMDFVLWKPSSPELPGWDSPWGRGRPGWHIECSAMSEAYLGETFDIHGGGIDLLFPHHENEIAQSEGAHPKSHFAKLWMHNGFLQVEGEKMAKSAGNFVTIDEILSGWRGRAWPGSAVRWAMLQKHYHEPIDWTVRMLSESATEIQQILNIIRGRYRNKQTGRVELDTILSVVDDPQPSSEIISALQDDLDTPEVIRAIRAMKKDSSKTSIDEVVRNLSFLGVIRRSDVRYLSNFHGISSDIENRDGVLTLATDYQVARANNDVSFAESIVGELQQKGLAIIEREPFELVVTKSGDTSSFEESVQKLVAARSAARKAKNFKESDRIRAELESQGIILKDNPDGTTNWEVKR